jgi:hypothetical protein
MGRDNFPTRHYHVKFDRNMHFCLDWLGRTIDMLDAEYISGILEKQHVEAWYIVRLWGH